MVEIIFSEKISEEVVDTLIRSYLDQIDTEDKVVFKIHFGESGNSRYVEPRYVKIIADAVKTKTNNIILSDCSTLYKGMRANATDHLAVAEKHGFSSIGVQLNISDGENGNSEYSVNINQKHFSEVYLGKSYEDADVIIAITHFKGHMLHGFGGAIKNIGMGMGSRRGKLAMHSKVAPEINQPMCTSCNKCVEHCEANAITMDGKAKIIPDRCVGCAMCISICPQKAITAWGGASGEDVMERTAEYALGAKKAKKLICINFLNKITDHCDCAPDSTIISEDVGICSSNDMVAIDQASFDLIIKKNGKDIFNQANGANAMHILEYGEQIGIGLRQYELKKI